jgi:hypothetical protein
LSVGCATVPEATTDRDRPATKADEGEYVTVDFDRLSAFPFALPPNDPDPATPPAHPYSVASQIPAEIKALDGQKVRMTGYMASPRMEGSLVVEFTLQRQSPPGRSFEPMPYLPDPPRMNEQVLVRLAAGVKRTVGAPISCTGTLHVRGMYRGSFLVGIYQLDDARVQDAK